MPNAPATTAPTATPTWLRLAPLVFLLLWSGGYAVAKLGLAHCDPLTFLAIRYASALALLLPLWAIYRPPLPKTLADWGHLAVVGLLIQVLYFGLSYMSFSHGVSAGAVALIVSLQPIVVGLLAPLVVAEKVTIWRWLGLILGLLGAGLVIHSRSSIEATSAIGIGCAVAALLGMSTATLYEKRFGIHYHPLTSNSVQYAVGLAAILPMAALTEPMHVEWVPELLAALAYLVVGNSLIAVTLLLAMVRQGEASRVSALLFLVPPMAALIAWGLIGEHMPPLAWLGMAVAGAGVLLATRVKS